MAAHPMHVERTDDPAVLRWVCHLPRPLATPVGPDSPLGELVATGRLAEVRADGGDVLVTVGRGGWERGLIRATDDAVRRTLATDGAPTVEAVQEAVDHAVGAIAAEHGGRIEVIELVDDVVVVDLHGACAGCAGAERTLVEVAQLAVSTEFPALSRVRARAGATQAVRFIRARR